MALPPGRSLVVAALAVSLLANVCPGRTAEPQPAKIVTEADLPRHTYPVTESTASALLDNAAAFSLFAKPVLHDTEALLASGAVSDAALQRILLATIRNLAMVDGDVKASAQANARIRALTDKPAEKALVGLRENAVLATQDARDDAARHAVYRKHLKASLDALKWDEVAIGLKQLMSNIETGVPSFYRGMIQAELDPKVSRDKSLDDSSARTLIAMQKELSVMARYREDTLTVLGEYIARNDVAKVNIWRDRTVSLERVPGLTPVVVGIWDTGLDASLFPGRMLVNAAEQIDGKDNDGNGYIDDVNGIGFDVDGAPVIPLLLDYSGDDLALLPETRDIYKGKSDLDAGVDSPEAAALRARMATIKPEEIGPMMERVLRFMYYSHGTHVAGIAAQGNPAVRLVSVRSDFSWKTVPPPITDEVAKAWADGFRKSVAYLQASRVRVVNMSWGLTPAEVEYTLEANGIGADAAERKGIAAPRYELMANALREAIASAPEILFVTAAGNSDSDVDFARAIPAGIVAPNLICAGAVDEAGGMANFTSLGKGVRVFTNGVNVESYIPGGAKFLMSGTSMASPQVTNLAAKLFALDASLTPEKVIDLITRGAAPLSPGAPLLMDEKKSIEILRGSLH